MLPLHYHVYTGQFDFLNGFEWVILLIIILLIFGPTKLPQLARGLGQAIYEFRKASQGVVEEEEEEKPKKKAKAKAASAEDVDSETLRELAKKLGVENADEMDDKELARIVLQKAKEKGMIKEVSQ